jgi:hypothetical protein
MKRKDRKVVEFLISCLDGPEQDAAANSLCVILKLPYESSKKDLKAWWEKNKGNL